MSKSEIIEELVDVYVAEMPAEGEMPPLSCALRQQDIDGVSNPDLRRQKYYVWRLLEYALQHSFGLTEQDVTFRKEGGRYLCDRACFSLSHSGNGLAVAVSRAAVGVDLERATARDIDRLSRRVLNEAETAIYDALPPEEREPFFFRAWTAKEALFKTTGQDVFAPPQQDTLQGGVRSYETVIGGEN